MKGIFRVIVDIPANGLIFLVRFYQVTISRWMGASCRFTPTCSSYFIQAVKKYGALRGSFKGCVRILKCHPLHRGGHDPP